MGSWASKPKRTPGRPREHILREYRQPASTAEHRETERYIYFYEPPGAFCTWTVSPFTMRGKRFNCAEQGLIWLKAMQFSDHDTASAVLKAHDPSRQQELEREVRNCDDRAWLAECEQAMLEVLRCKFRQNEDYKRALLATDSKILVHASPEDVIWGIGMAADECIACGEDEMKWRGENLLGVALTHIRDEMR